MNHSERPAFQQINIPGSHHQHCFPRQAILAFGSLVILIDPFGCSLQLVVHAEDAPPFTLGVRHRCAEKCDKIVICQDSSKPYGRALNV